MAHNIFVLYLVFDQHRRFVGCDVDTEVVIAAEPDSVGTSASHVLNPKSDINKSSEVKAASKVSTDKMRAFLASKKAFLWEVPPKLNATQVMAGHVLHILSNMYEDYSLSEMCRHTSFSLWSPVWRNRLCSTDPTVLLAHECGRLEVPI